MKSLLVPALAAAALAGCGETRTASLPAPFTGTWHQVKAVNASGLGIDDPQEIGFLSLGDAQVLCDLDGLPKGATSIGELSVDAVQGSGRLALANGLRLYLVVGHGLADYAIPGGRVVGACDYLDVEFLRTSAGGGEETVRRLRLWSSSAVTAASLAVAERHTPTVVVAAPIAPAPSTTVPPVITTIPSRPVAEPSASSLPAVHGRDAVFTDAASSTGDQSLAAAALGLVRIRERGDDAELVAAYHRLVLSAQREVLALLDQARQGGSVELAEARKRSERLADFTRAYTAWTQGRP